MKANESSLNAHSITTTDVDAGSAPAGPGPGPGSLSASTAGPPLVSPHYAPPGPEPQGTDPAMAQEMAQTAKAQGANSPGVEGEQIVWEARYSMKNFIGRLTSWTLLSLGWLALLVYLLSEGKLHGAGAFVTGVMGVSLAIAWLALIYRIVQARLGHFYQLTTRRLFVSTGVFRRRRDQMELISVKDVFERQTMIERWLGVGTVVVVSPEAELPTFYLTGVNNPKQVMDLIWHCARTEREGKTVQVESV